MTRNVLYVFLIFLLFCDITSAQIPVDKEPHHKVVLQNKYLRLIDGHVPFGDTTPAHVHSVESVVVFLSKSTFGISVSGEKPVITTVNPGDVRYSAYGTKPVTHKVWNQSKPMFHFLVAELVKKHPENDTCPAITNPDVKLSVSQKLVRVYSLDIAKGKQLNIPKSNCPHLLINITGIAITIAAGKTHVLNAGAYVYFPPGSSIPIKSSDKANAKCVLIEMKYQ